MATEQGRSLWPLASADAGHPTSWLGGQGDGNPWMGDAGPGPQAVGKEGAGDSVFRPTRHRTGPRGKHCLK